MLKLLKNHKIGFTVSLVLLFIVLILLWQLSLVFLPVRSAEKIITIRKGESAASIGKHLEQEKLIRSGLWFRILARVTHSDTYLKPGKFVFGGYTNLMETLSKIRNGKSMTITITIPEGLSAFKTFQVLAKSGIAPAADFDRLSHDSLFVRTITGHPYTSLEGFLYPETYKFSSTVTTDSVLAELVDVYHQKTAALQLPPAQSSAYYQTLILASIVEDEAVMKDEKPVIASVYLNRLAHAMKLESCPTVAYLLEKQGIHRQYLLYKDLKIDSPYNTYFYAGLPPTPICSPSVSSIQAVLQPAKTNYLFFFADMKGRNIFSATYAEHLQKQRQFKQKQKIQGETPS
jgi:UPF0755 protein